MARPLTRVTVPCIGLTGGIGAGKSEALAAFADAGAAVLSSDAVVHDLYRDPEVVAAVVGRFGPQVMSGDAVDRRAVGERVFGDPEALRFLEGLIHPRIGIARDAWVAAQRARTPAPPLLVCEVPLLFEADLARHFDLVVVITASEAVRRQRVEARGQDYDARTAHQLPEATKVAAADAVYVNDGSVEDLRRWVGALVARLTAAPPGRSGA